MIERDARAAVSAMVEAVEVIGYILEDNER